MIIHIIVEWVDIKVYFKYNFQEPLETKKLDKLTSTSSFIVI